MGVATGWLPAGGDIKTSALFDLAKGDPGSATYACGQLDSVHSCWGLVSAPVRCQCEIRDCHSGFNPMPQVGLVTVGGQQLGTYRTVIMSHHESS